MIGLVSVTLICGATWAYTDQEKDRTEGVPPLLISALSTSDVSELLREGITKSALQQKINSLPLLRIGPGYVIYHLKDGKLRLPLSDGSKEKVTEWELTNFDGTRIAEQAASSNH